MRVQEAQQTEEMQQDRPEAPEQMVAMEEMVVTQVLLETREVFPEVRGVVQERELRLPDLPEEPVHQEDV